METKYLRKIILEELQKVLKEEDGFGGPLTARRPDVQAGTSRDIERHYDTQADIDFEKFQTKSRAGMKCKNGIYLQDALKNKLSKNSGYDLISKRLNDGIIGETTIKLINLFQVANKKEQIPVNSEWYKKLCSSNVDSIINTIQTTDTSRINLNNFMEYLKSRAGSSSRFKDTGAEQKPVFRAPEPESKGPEAGSSLRSSR